MPTIPTVVTELEAQAFAALVSKGIRFLLFPMVRTGNVIEADTTTNILNGYPVGGFSSSGDTVDSQEFQDQLMGGEYKSFIAGAIDGGDITLNTYFAIGLGKPNLSPIVNSTVITPQYILILAVESSTSGSLQGFFASGVNYSGGSDLKGDYGQIVGSSFKFKQTGMLKIGATAVGLIDEELYGPLPYQPIPIDP